MRLRRKSLHKDELGPRLSLPTLTADPTSIWGSEVMLSSDYDFLSELMTWSFCEIVSLCASITLRTRRGPGGEAESAFLSLAFPARAVLFVAALSYTQLRVR